MLNKIVYSVAPVTLLGAGDVSQEVLQVALAIGPELICADGGADHAFAFGLTPEAVIGDLDSLSEATRAALPPDVIHAIPEQNSTDFDKALRSIAAPLVLGVGFDGSRIDHHLAALHVLLARPDQRCILLSEEQITFLAPPHLHLDLPEGMLVSLFPMGAVTGRSEGLRWPIEGLKFAPDSKIGTSNEVSPQGADAMATLVQLQFDQPQMLVILPRAALAASVAGLNAAFVGWPARAE